MSEYPELAALPPAAVEALWAQWSEDTLCASWVAVEPGPHPSFERWLFETSALTETGPEEVLSPTTHVVDKDGF